MKKLGLHVGMVENQNDWSFKKENSWCIGHIADSNILELKF